MHSRTTSAASTALLIGLSLLAGGCADIIPFTRPAVPPLATAEVPAAEMICLWQPAKGPGLNGIPTRGLAGRIMFFTRHNPSPVIVDGEVRVYLFDNRGTPEQQARPIHQFDFRAADWQSFLQRGTLGPTYSVFIPYIPGGHEQVDCAVQVRFTPTAGPVVYSDMTSVTLPGQIDAQDAGFLPEMPDPETVASILRSAEELSAPPRPGLTVHTIHQNPVQPASHAAPAAAEETLDAARLLRRGRAAGAGTAAVGLAPPTTDRRNAISGGQSLPYGTSATGSLQPAPLPRDRRLDRLEQMMRQLLEDRQTAPLQATSEPLPAAEIDRPPHTEPRRFRLAPAAVPPRPLTAHPLAEGTGHDQSATRRAAHHPLAEVQGPAPAPERQPSAPSPRQVHPLATPGPTDAFSLPVRSNSRSRAWNKPRLPTADY